jgi:hypothetical protein
MRPYGIICDFMVVQRADALSCVKSHEINFEFDGRIGIATPQCGGLRAVGLDGKVVKMPTNALIRFPHRAAGRGGSVHNSNEHAVPPP